MVQGALRPGVLGPGVDWALTMDLVGPGLALVPAAGLVGKAGVGMLLSTVAVLLTVLLKVLVTVLTVAGGRGVEEELSGGTVVLGGGSLPSLGEREETLARLILFISWARAVKPSIRISSRPSRRLSRLSMSE